MSAETARRESGVGRSRLLGVGGVVVLAVLTLLGAMAGVWKVLAIAWVAFLAMALGAPLGARAAGRPHAHRLVWGYGLASGAMITSAAMFVVPGAIGPNPPVGGFGIAVGILVGFGSHTIGHRLAHLDLPLDTTAAQITAHALSAGAIIGVIYAAMPDLGLLLGLAIVSHKGPAGYAAARRMASQGRSPVALLLPAAGVGLTAIPMALLTPPVSASVRAAVFGFAAGVFLHVAMDFLPECEIGGEVGEVAQLTGEAHQLLDRLRVHAVLSTMTGGLAVFGAWLALS
ncbi:MAG: ZIP family metal transporter [Haloarculaceae archaeon]